MQCYNMLNSYEFKFNSFKYLDFVKETEHKEVENIEFTMNFVMLMEFWMKN